MSMPHHPNRLTDATAASWGPGTRAHMLQTTLAAAYSLKYAHILAATPSSLQAHAGSAPPGGNATHGSAVTRLSGGPKGRVCPPEASPRLP